MEAVDKQERVSVGLDKFTEAMKKFSKSVSKASEVFHNLNEDLRNTELGEEAKRKLAYKKEDIVRYATQTVGMSKNELLSCLTDGIVLQALCHEYSPATVVSCLIADRGFKRAVVQRKNGYIAESMKRLGLR